MNSAEEKTSIEIRVTEILHELGMPVKLKGYRYSRMAICMVYGNQNLLGAITKNVYPEVAKAYEATSKTVERGIRMAIDAIWKNGDPAILDKYLGKKASYTTKRITNSEFIARIADYLLIEDLLKRE